MNHGDPVSGCDWSRLAQDLEQRFETLEEAARGGLRELVREGCSAVGSMESSLLVPSQNGASLKFLVSVNPSLEKGEELVPCDRSLAGYVFATGQPVAVNDVAEEESERHFAKIDEKTGLRTHQYLAVPVMDEDEILAVLTYVNRPSGAPEVPFSQAEIECAQRYAALCSVALKYYQRIRLQGEIARSELERSLARTALKTIVGGIESGEASSAGPSPILSILRRLESLPWQEQQLFSELCDLLLRFRVDRTRKKGFGDQP